MITAHIEKLFATRIAVFVKSLTEAMPDGMHFTLHWKRKKEMTSAEHRSINALKGLFGFGRELYVEKIKTKKFVHTVHLYSSKTGLQREMNVFKP